MHFQFIHIFHVILYSIDNVILNLIIIIFYYYLNYHRIALFLYLHLLGWLIVILNVWHRLFLGSWIILSCKTWMVVFFCFFTEAYALSLYMIFRIELTLFFFVKVLVLLALIEKQVTIIFIYNLWLFLYEINMFYKLILIK